MRPLRDHVPRLPSYDDYVASLRRSTCNNASISIVAVTVPEQHHDNTTRAFLDTYRRVASQNSWNYTTLRGVDGFNTTDVIESLLDTGIPFRNLSRGARSGASSQRFSRRSVHWSIRSHMHHPISSLSRTICTCDPEAFR